MRLGQPNPPRPAGPRGGYFSTVAACRKLGVPTERLLALRREALEQALGIKPLPMLARRKTYRIPCAG
ncbi:MAG TPA: hypothetical protein VH682_24585 [Gemmataceae bacterium]